METTVLITSVPHTVLPECQETLQIGLLQLTCVCVSVFVCECARVCVSVLVCVQLHMNVCGLAEVRCQSVVHFSVTVHLVFLSLVWRSPSD